MLFKVPLEMGIKASYIVSFLILEGWSQVLDLILGYDAKVRIG